ncbi:hypothetical protein [Streptomyces rubellomurinus]|uniref:Uncharacterized protein n=1 Tax=Streptomyces rubellomurinus (strain ATCC 31215) TaxID=359131 RepID=A0A0F2TN34_STRR3|nr:hypothetical protein [Streptomyces rubellomurinus]KJS63142.1 hypothetical protein VM95_03970 [Streptomyces rubellomurinus]
MPNGQQPGGAEGYGAAPRHDPYGQPVPPQPVPNNPYAQPYGQQPYVPPQFAAPQFAAPPGAAQPRPPHPGGPSGPAGPLPRRNRALVLLQFVLQWIYAPLWILGLVLVFLLVIVAALGNANIDGPSSDGWLRVNRSFIPPRRLRAELSGRPEVWERYVTPILARRIAAAEAKYAAGDGTVLPDHGREVRIELAARLYRGLGAVGVIRLAERYGWRGADSGADREHVRLARAFPAPAAVPAPSPQDPPAAPGTPWGPQPVRFAPLLPLIAVAQLVYVPVFGLLTCWVSHPEPDWWDRWGARWTVGPRAFRAEFTNSPAAWERHVRRILKRYAKAPAPAAGTVPNPGTLQRIRLNRATYRGIGAQQALRIAAEQGWAVDPAYLPDPAHSLRLARPLPGQNGANP